MKHGQETVIGIDTTTLPSGEPSVVVTRHGQHPEKGTVAYIEGACRVEQDGTHARVYISPQTKVTLNGG